MLDKMFRRTRLATILMGVALLVVGVAIFVAPITATLLIVSVVGWTLTIVGVVTLVNCVMHRAPALHQTDLVIGLVELVCGVLMLATPQTFVAFIYVLLGVVVLATGVGDVLDALALRAAGLPWVMPMVLGALTLVAGAFVVASPFAMAEFVMLVAGLALLYDGVTEIVAGLSMRNL